MTSNRSLKPAISLLLTLFLGLCAFGSVFSRTGTNPLIIDNEIQLVHIRDSVFLHITWDVAEGYGRFSSNGLVFIKNGQALMVDTPMDNAKTERLTEYIENVLHAKVTDLIIGHFHDDCLGGLGYLQTIGVESTANALTVEKCKELGLPVPSIAFSGSHIVHFQGEQIECHFFGAGHTFDNITVWFPEKYILFGGCLVKSAESQNLGNLADAVVEDWDETIARLIQAYPNAELVIPGHGQIGDTALLRHTLDLIAREKHLQSPK